MQFTQLKRREFITLLGGATAWPMSARAQSSPMRRVGVLNPFAENDPEHANVAAFRQALEKLGWTNGGNVRIDYRWGGADPARIRAQAKENVAFQPGVILLSTALALQPLLQETRSIPMVVTRIVDPVGSGFVASLQAATSPASRSPSFRYLGNWLKCSRRSRRKSRESRCFSIRTKSLKLACCR